MDEIKRFVHKEFIEQESKFSDIYYYLDKYVSKDVVFPSMQLKNEIVKINHTIWIFWYQGIENAPDLVQKCFESVYRNKPKNFEVVLLTAQNLDDYIIFPDWIWQKYNEGYFNLTHLSDILRIELLYVYGGCWIDATVFCSGKIPQYMLSGDIFMFNLASVATNPVLKMSSWWIFANQGNRLVQLTRQTIYEYWKYETDIHDYFLLHIIMSKIIDEDEQSKAAFQTMTYFNSGNAHILQRKLGIEFDAHEWENIKAISPVHKLSYKNRYIRGDLYNYYSALLEGKLA